MGCGCGEFKNPEHVRTRGSLKVNVLALREALGGRPELVQSMQAKSTGRPKVNAGAMWQMFQSSVYASQDLPVLATREALQNSVDAVRAAVRGRKTRAGEGRFAVTWDPDTRALTWEDNGIGMDEATVWDKFLSLGDSGKRDAADSSEAAGGFGVAKAVILGASPTFRWELITRDNRFVASGFHNEIENFDAPYLQGTRLTVRDVSQSYDVRYVREQNARLDLLDRLRHVLAANDLPEITLVLNGEVVRPFFARNAGARVAMGGSWGTGTTARIKAYRRGPGDRRGGYYVRLNGLFQFGRGTQRGNLPADVVIDLSTTVRPGSPDYPLNAARDSFNVAAEYQFRDLADEVEKENESAGIDLEDDVIDPETDESEDGMALAESTRAAFEDPDFQRVFADAKDGLADLLKAEAELVDAPIRPRGSTAPAGTLPPSKVPMPGLSRVPDNAADMLRQVLGEADAAAGGTVLDDDAKSALVQLGSGATLTDAEARALEDAADRATQAAAGPGGGGLLQVAQVVQAVQAVEKYSPLPKRKRNPFGTFAGIRVSKKNYDKAKARRFKASIAKWLPYLTVWDATLRLMAAESGMRRRFKPGFCLDTNAVGKAAAGPDGGAIVYINPDIFKAYVKAHAERPIAIATFLRELAAHELTHADGRLVEGHDEKFTSAREDLGSVTAHLTEAIAMLCVKVLGLPARESPEQKKIRDLERQLARVKDSSTDARRLRRDLARAQTSRAAALEEASREQRAAVLRGCPDCFRRVEEAIEVYRANMPPNVTPFQFEKWVAGNIMQIARFVDEHDRSVG